MTDSSADQLRAAARELGVAVDARQAAQLLRLLAELEQWNRAYSLTGIDSQAAMIGTHLLDSLAASGDLVGSRIADLGTGAGFPGLPLAIVNPERQFTLIDATAKKVRFVAHAARTLGLGNVQAVHARAGQTRSAPPFPGQPFDTIVARALGALPQLAALARPLARPGTRLLAYKGRHPEGELAELATLAKLARPGSDWQLLGVRALKIPGLAAERCLVILEAGPGSANSP
jgi:16S rRNA (guanine527-N7)-methyltransferase